MPIKKHRSGFATMDPAKRRAIASKAGKAAHAKGLGHEWDRAEAREAGRKGGLATARRKREALAQRAQVVVAYTAEGEPLVEREWRVLEVKGFG